MFFVFYFRSRIMEEKHNELILQACGIFMQYGIRSVTMDDLARHLGVSKKTIYQVVKDKNELVLKCVELNRNIDQCNVSSICGQNLNAIDELFEISKMVVEQLSGVHPSIFYDMEKYHRDAWGALQHHKQSYIYDCIRGNLLKGIEQGMYRDDLHVDVIAKIYVSRIDDLWNGSIFPPDKYKLPEIYLEMFRYHIRGVASQEGINYLIEKVKHEKSKNQ